MKQRIYFNLNGTNGTANVFPIVLSQEYNIRSLKFISSRVCMDRTGLTNETQDILLHATITSKNASSVINMSSMSHFISAEHTDLVGYFPVGTITGENTITENHNEVPLVNSQTKFGPNLTIELGETQNLYNVEGESFAHSTLKELTFVGGNNQIELCFEIDITFDPDIDEPDTITFSR